MPNLTDRKMFKLAAERFVAHQSEKDGKTRKQEIDALIVPELDRRGVRATSGGGWKITKVTQTYKVYNIAKARKVLKPKVYASIVVDAIDPDKLAQALSDGVISDKQLAKFAELVPKSTYLSVTPDVQSADDA